MGVRATEVPMNTERSTAENCMVVRDCGFQKLEIEKFFDVMLLTNE